MNQEQEHAVVREGLLDLIARVENHCLAVQSGWTGTPSILLLQEVGKLHTGLVLARAAILSTEKE